jgi:protein TonB
MADMFRAVVCSSTGRPRRWRSSLPLSVALHGVVLAAALIVPLAATGALPTPASVLSFSMVVPPPPPEIPAAPSADPPIALAPIPVPIEAPTAPAPDPPPVTSVSEPPIALMAAPGPRVFGSGSGAPRLTGQGGGMPVLLPAPPPTPIRPGDRVRAPVKIVDVAPVYPPLAVRARVAGVVTIDAVIGVDGRVTEARVLRSVALLDDAALNAVRQWRYTPTLLNGVAVPVILTVSVNFALK